MRGYCDACHAHALLTDEYSFDWRWLCSHCAASHDVAADLVAEAHARGEEMVSTAILRGGVLYELALPTAHPWAAQTLANEMIRERRAKMRT